MVASRVALEGFSCHERRTIVVAEGSCEEFLALYKTGIAVEDGGGCREERCERDDAVRIVPEKNDRFLNCGVDTPPRMNTECRFCEEGQKVSQSVLVLLFEPGIKSIPADTPAAGAIGHVNNTREGALL